MLRLQDRARCCGHRRWVYSILSEYASVLSFASCTLGWSKALMPSNAPATAVANSQRKNSAPRSYRFRRAAAARPAGPPLPAPQPRLLRGVEPSTRCADRRKGDRSRRRRARPASRPRPAECLCPLCQCSRQSIAPPSSRMWRPVARHQRRFVAPGVAPAAPRIVPSQTPGFRGAATSPAQALAIASARSSSVSTSIPMMAAGTSPK